MVKYGIIILLISLVGGFVRGANNLSKGEADANYSTAGANDLVGYLFMVLFWGGLLVIFIGIISNITNKSGK